MRCNNRSTAERINALIEKKTMVVFSESRDEGIGSGTTFLTPKGIGYGTMAGMLVSNSSIMNMPFGRQYALIQKHHNRLIKLKTPSYFKDREMVKKTKLPPPPPLPISIYNQRNEEDKLPPPQDMSVEPEYIQAKKLADKEKEIADAETAEQQEAMETQE